ncbi:two pore calcium channel protein 1-like [Neocloeon triangulifer]|uniref:two pore calcium channel protein 1-like n=1 Tax=Neocloeon triangulifer TaxID=2078957 RepID=UPI00286ED6DD|nr:two pore calcium channel protein 1-like [Neocloeon triangulifer]XP_059474257.1 two pore calcium channel protein 1-like [Neocloeon triangulifer]XP_059474258.1 two pore calcium channel protein 1-like [Neocloeon triangulifer]XP_059474259.1 two pore calcium channel protein 1-like [Neocloeon triangulifer]XP_059474260.1 two pore calcium channel protein 1-like [Neocloeon triangulifer]
MSRSAAADRTYTRFHDDRPSDEPVISAGMEEFDEILQQELATNEAASIAPHPPQPHPDLWEMNYHEAAIFLHEGENNEKFDSHPKNPEALPAYLMVHSSWYHGLDLAASIVLLALALVEPPAGPLFQLPIFVHGAIELVALTIIGIEQAMKFRWLGWKPFFKHKRTTIKGVALVTMVVEACVVLVRQSSHFRVTRAMRPIFLMDNHHCGGVRRFIRQIFQSLPPIVDMLGLLMVIVALYSLLAFFLFGLDPDDPYFRSLPDAFVNLFVLLTTANFPDVMMPAYARSRWNSIFFVSYLSIVLYLLMNLLLAVVYEAFTSIERDKFRKLLLHKREAVKRAFTLLAEPAADQPSVSLVRFAGLMKYFRPKKSFRDVLLTFKFLDGEGRGRVTLSELMDVYNAASLRWTCREPKQPWFAVSRSPARLLGKLSVRLFEFRHFETLVLVSISANVLLMAFRVVRTEDSERLEHSALSLVASWDTFLFATLFSVEAVVRCCALGASRYLASGWNCYDLAATVALWVAVMGVRARPQQLAFLVLARPLRLMRLFKVKKRFRDVFGTLLLLMPLMSSAALVMLLLYYFFAVVGMELFASFPMKNCCLNSTVEAYYRDKAEGGVGLYYLNSFSDLLSSGVVLFELTVVNNWHVTMEGYAVASKNAFSRLYFMTFYLVTMVVLTIVVASILGAFRFRIQYKEQTSKEEERRMLSVDVHLHWEELSAWLPHVPPTLFAEQIGLDIKAQGSTSFLGTRARTTEVLQKKMYKEDVARWLAEEHSAATPNSRLLSESWSNNPGRH